MIRQDPGLGISGGVEGIRTGDGYRLARIAGSRAGARLVRLERAGGRLHSEEPARFIDRRRLRLRDDVAGDQYRIAGRIPPGDQSRVPRQAVGPLRHVHRLSHHLFRPHRLLVRARTGGDRRSGDGEPGLCAGDAVASARGHLSPVLDAGGEPIRFGGSRLDLRRQHDLAGGDVAPRFARRRTRQRPRGRTGRTHQARRPDCVCRAVHDREPVLARLRHAALSARSRLSARGARRVSALRRLRGPVWPIG